MSRTVARLNLSAMRQLIRPDPMRRPNFRLTPSKLLQVAFYHEMNRTMDWDEDQCWTAHSELTERLGSRGLLIFDGLDEVLDETDRTYVCKTILRAAEELGSNCGILVTARPYAYSPAELGSFSIWRFLPLTLPRDHGNDGQVGLLVRNWHKALRIPDAQSDALIAALREDPDRLDMAKRPLLLTLLIGVHARRMHKQKITALPRIRVDLLDEATQLMMERWFQRIDRDSEKGEGQIPPHIVEWLAKRGSNEKSELRRLAEQVSFEVQNRRKGRVDADIELSRHDFIVVVGKLVPKMTFETIERTVRLILDRTALWFSRGDHEASTEALYAYIHRQFQEFLAACQIVESPDERKQLPRKLGENPAAWREVARLAVVWTARSQAESAASSLLRELMPNCTAGSEGAGTGSTGSNAATGDSRAGVYQHLIATGWTLLDLHAALDQDALGNRVIEEDLTRVATDFQSCYQRLISDSEAPGHLRLEAGEIAGRLGLALGASFADARPGIVPVAWNTDVDEPFALTVHDFRWVPIPSGPHLWMARYPITQSQYAAFVRTEGRSRHFEDCPSYWKFSTEAVEWWMKNHRAPDVSTANIGGNGSLLKDALPNFPVVGVSWFDAVAFCHWLETQLSLETGNWIRPPTCNQWQQAAVRWRGALPQRIQGARTDRDCDAAMGAVGLYDPEPGSTEPQIPVDLSGSIFEWVLTKWDAKAVGPVAGGYQLDSNADDLVGAVDRLILGGPFRHDADARRQQSSRAHLAPDTEDIRVGFRICLHGDLEYLTRIPIASR